MRRTEQLRLLAALTFFLILATVYNLTATPFESPDEVSHFYYLVQLLENKGLPIMPPPTGDAPHYGQEGTQTPLYYGSAALFIRALTAPLKLDLSNAQESLQHNPHSSCRADPTARYNRAYLPHDPHQERFPYTGRVRVLHLARFWSSLLATAALAGIFATTRELFPQTPAAAWCALTLTLWWQSIAPLAQAQTAFIHLYDANGELLATADRPPLHGGFPTSLWLPGDRVREQYTIKLPADAQRPLQIGLGWYNPVDGRRLPATLAGESLPAASYLITISEDMP